MWTFPFERLKLNVPYHVPEVAELSLAGLGTFRNKDLQLTWSGISKRNGEECSLIEYRAFFNTLDFKSAEVNMEGRSHYWGQLWVSMKTGRIEYATLYEDVLGEVTIPSMAKPLTINVFRIGTFEPVKK